MLVVSPVGAHTQVCPYGLAENETALTSGLPTIAGKEVESAEAPGLLYSSPAILAVWF